jgi:hypothetical protein
LAQEEVLTWYFEHLNLTVWLKIGGV